MFDDLRNQIDILDKNILSLLKKRFVIVRQIGTMKKGHDLPVIDEDRETLIQLRLIEIAKKEGLDLEFVSSIYDLILKESRRLQ